MAPEIDTDDAPTQPEFDTTTVSMQKLGVEIGNVLCCPACGHNYMHQGELTRSSGKNSVMTTIEMWCEECDDLEQPFELVIRERKGNTMLYWDPETAGE